MLDLSEITARLRDGLPDLASVDGVAELAAVLAAPPQPHQRPRAFVALQGLRGGVMTAAAGAFIQEIDHTVAIYLLFPAHADPTGARAQVDIAAMQAQVIELLCGWVPASASVAPMRLVKAQLADLRPGLVVQTIEFGIADQLRIAR